MATSLARAGNRVTVDSVVGSADPLCANAHRLNPKGTVRLAHLATQCRCESRSPVRATRRGVFRWEIENGESPATKDRLRSIVPASRLGDPSPCR